MAVGMSINSKMFRGPTNDSGGRKQKIPIVLVFRYAQNSVASNFDLMNCHIDSFLKIRRAVSIKIL